MNDIASVPEPIREAHLYLSALESEAKWKSEREKHRKYLKDFITDHCEIDDQGNYVFTFPKPMMTENGICNGLMLQRRTSEWVEEEKARNIISKHNLENRCIRTYEVSDVDYDELYAANQEGIISDEEIDSILEISESYALVKVKG